MMEDVRVNRKLWFGLNVTDKLGGGFSTWLEEQCDAECLGLKVGPCHRLIE